MRTELSRALEELEKTKVKLILENRSIRAVYRCERSALPAVLSAIAILRQHKEEALSVLRERTTGGFHDVPRWPAESLDAEHRFRCPEARLYPFLEQKVRTPLGLGKLIQVFKDRAAVLLDQELIKPKGEQRESYFNPSDICPVLEVKDVTWINASGREMQTSDWGNGKMRCFGMLTDGRAQTSGIKRRASDVTLLIVLNGYYEAVKFTLPEFVGGDRWLTFIDTNDPERSEVSTLKTGDKYEVAGRSLLLLAALTSGEPVTVIRRLALDLLDDAERSA
jgi:hypothetical protein